METLRQHLTDLFSKAFHAVGYDAAYGKIERCILLDRTHYLCNGVLAAVQDTAESSEFIARQVIDNLSDYRPFARLSTVGAGIITIRLADEYLTHHIISVMRDDRWIKSNLEWNISNLLSQINAGYEPLWIDPLIYDASLHHAYTMMLDLEHPHSFPRRTRSHLLDAMEYVESMLRQSLEPLSEWGSLIPPKNRAEEHLLFLLAELPDAVLLASQTDSTEYLAGYVDQLAFQCIKFCAECRIPTEPDKLRQASWLQLTRFCLSVMTSFLPLVGMQAADQYERIS